MGDIDLFVFLVIIWFGLFLREMSWIMLSWVICWLLKWIMEVDFFDRILKSVFVIFVFCLID